MALWQLILPRVAIQRGRRGWPRPEPSPRREGDRPFGQAVWQSLRGWPHLVCRSKADDQPPLVLLGRDDHAAVRNDRLPEQAARGIAPDPPFPGRFLAFRLAIR